MIGKAKNIGFTIVLLFICLESIELAKSRVAVRVSKGGHNIPGDVIERRYFKGMKNFSLYTDTVNDWYIYDNSGPEYVLIAKSIDSNIEIFNFGVYNNLKGYAG